MGQMDVTNIQLEDKMWNSLLNLKMHSDFDLSIKDTQPGKDVDIQTTIQPIC
jgi:hypothetical protein